MSPEIARLGQRLQAYNPDEQSTDTPSGWASVAVIVHGGHQGPELLFIERAKHDNDPWSGHMAFPGGRRDPQDPAIISTAIRETREELSLDLITHGRLLGQLDDVQAIGRGKRLPLIIRPYVFHLPHRQPLAPNYEVETTVWVPLNYLAAPESVSTFPYNFRGEHVDFPCYDYQGHRIWGLTFGMVQSLLGVIAAQPSP